MPPIKLITKAQWDKMLPTTQGYLCYLQGGLPGSELKAAVCPYRAGTAKAKEFAAGEFAAMLDAQDSED